MRLLILFFVAASAIAQMPRSDPEWVKRETTLHVVYSMPGMNEVRVRRDIIYKRVDGRELKMDVYTPGSVQTGGKLHVVVFIHGGYLPPNLLTEPKDWGSFKSRGRLAAAAGFAAITFNHRFYNGWDALRDAKQDLADLLAFVRQHASEYGGLDGDHITLWTFSGSGPLLTEYIAEPHRFVSSLVSYYADLDLRPELGSPNSHLSQQICDEFSATPFLGKAKRVPPMFIGRAGKDSPVLNRGVDGFIAEALKANVMLDLATHPEGRHGFDTENDDRRSREILRQTLDFIRAH